jgi:hypothetical protein
MTSPSQFPVAENALEAEAAASTSAEGLPFAKRFSSIARRIGDYIEVLADYYAAAAMYEQLSRLSGAELQRRGLSRETLARDVCAACDRGLLLERLVQGIAPEG